MSLQTVLSRAPLPLTQVLSWPPFLHQADRVLSALHEMFLQLAQHGVSGAAALQPPTLSTNPLRQALSALPGGKGECQLSSTLVQLQG